MSEQQLRDMLDAMPELSDEHSYIPSQILARIYAEARAQHTRANESREPDPEPAEDPRSEDEIVAEELQLSPKLTIDDLLRIRREYAMSHHPDRVSPSERERATRRMTIANMLIDQAMRERRAAARAPRR
ncbi:MAG TPA: hypothetical protein VNK52_16525 [Hyphomicrobiaceae bacterium]|nr:hypothetical protein [Hyphomicrobiaceae bacterium]